MFGFGKKDKSKKDPQNPASDTSIDSADKSSAEPEKDAPITPAADEAERVVAQENEAEDSKGFFSRLKQGLSRTKGRLSDGLSSLVLGEKTIDAGLLEDIETQLLSADVGIEATDQVIENLKGRLSRKQLSEPEEFLNALKTELLQLIEPVHKPLQISLDSKPFVILMVGVNGVGKTTTIGKLAKRFQSQGKSVMLAAGDTFRAAAVEQLQVWGERNQVPVVAQATGADSASVIFDAFQSAQARNMDILIADTAGRLHNKDNLMNELEKIVRVLKKQDPRLPDEIMLVLDSTTGQNALSQASSFHKSTELTGLTLTKLDGTAKGGVVFALAKKLAIPIRYIGVGEQVDDLRPFDAKEFIEALFSE